MSKTGFFALTFLGVCLITFFIAALFAIASFPSGKLETHPKILVGSSNVLLSPIDDYKSQATFPKFATELKTDDARPVIVNNFLSKHSSPMSGLGGTFILVADKYGIDWRLLPAIAFQESNLGKKVPRGSHNAFGWAVFTGENSGVSFVSWEEAIETVASGIKERYVSQGLTTPEAIMTKYTPNNNGSWAFGVRFAMQEMTL